jgi:hypothetical protein
MRFVVEAAGCSSPDLSGRFDRPPLRRADRFSANAGRTEVTGDLLQLIALGDVREGDGGDLDHSGARWPQTQEMVNSVLSLRANQ